ncbi:MAG: PDP protein [Epsilonproteobacteria bacterium]|jgi:flagellar motility protein MotE (MotC chaperone)|nr:PDP protein [Campylobacterota bacterium]
MIKIVLILMISIEIFALQTSDKLYECTEIFKERKSELLVELERIDEQKQALEALRGATEELLKRKEEKISQDESRADAKLKDIIQKEKSIKELVAKNEKLLKELKDTKMGKMAQTFSKMKPANSATILSDMPDKEAVDILRSLKPKIVGKILSKMEPKKASTLTLLLSQ